MWYTRSIGVITSFNDSKSCRTNWSILLGNARMCKSSKHGNISKWWYKFDEFKHTQDVKDFLSNTISYYTKENDVAIFVCGLHTTYFWTWYTFILQQCHSYFTTINSFFSDRKTHYNYIFVIIYNFILTVLSIILLCHQFSFLCSLREFRCRMKENCRQICIQHTRPEWI